MVLSPPISDSPLDLDSNADFWAPPPDLLHPTVLGDPWGCEFQQSSQVILLHTEVLDLICIPYLMDGETEAQRGAETCSKMDRWSPAELSLECSDS